MNKSEADPTDKKCCRCKQVQPAANFAWRCKKSGRRAHECKACHAAYRKAYYEANRSKEIAAASTRKRDRLPQIKAALREIKSKLKCNRCDQNHPATLQFHHPDPSQKEAEVSKMVFLGFGVESILREIEKCEVLCANCHFIEHYNQRFN